MTKRGLIFILCLIMLLPIIAAAENTVEILPTAPPMPDLVVEENPYAFEDLTAYYEGEYEYQTPALTASEKERLADAQHRWDAGERPEVSILNLTENVHVALIQVPAEQYEGESWFLLLPARELTDDELLQMVDAYEQLGITLSADMITWHNTLRGGGIEIALRSKSDDERARYNAISEQFIRSGLRPETPFTDSVMDDGLGRVTLDEEDYSGAPYYTFYPARRMTDEELLQLYALNNPEPAASPSEMADYEMKLRGELQMLMGMPLSARRSEEESVHPANENNVYGDTRMSYNTSFTEADGTGRTWSGCLDISTGKLISATVILDDRYYKYGGIHSDIRMDPWDEIWATIATDTLLELCNFEESGITEILNYGEITPNELYCANIRIKRVYGDVYRAAVSFTFGTVIYIEYNDAVSIECEDNWAVHHMSQKEVPVNE